MAKADLATTLSIRIKPKSRDQLELLAKATGRTRSFLAVEAIEQYLKSQAWQIQGVLDAVDEADAKDAVFYDNDDVGKWLATWGSDDEQDEPK